MTKSIITLLFISVLFTCCKKDWDPTHPHEPSVDSFATVVTQLQQYTDFDTIPVFWPDSVTYNSDMKVKSVVQKQYQWEPNSMAYTYNTQGNISRATFSGSYSNYAWSFFYNSQNRLDSIAILNNSSTYLGPDTIYHRFTYDGNNRLKEMNTFRYIKGVITLIGKQKYIHGASGSLDSVYAITYFGTILRTMSIRFSGATIASANAIDRSLLFLMATRYDVNFTGANINMPWLQYLEGNQPVLRGGTYTYTDGFNPTANNQYNQPFYTKVNYYTNTTQVEQFTSYYVFSGNISILSEHRFNYKKVKK